MPSAVSRQQITNRVLAELNEAGFPVGDNNAPTAAYGWAGEPDEIDATFTPWMTLTPLAAQPQRIPGAVADTGTEWILPYMVFYAGASRKQCEALADKMRLALTNIERERVDSPSGGWRIMKISCTAIGSNSRTGSAFPDYYAQSDTFEVWISKERS